MTPRSTHLDQPIVCRDLNAHRNHLDNATVRCKPSRLRRPSHRRRWRVGYTEHPGAGASADVLRTSTDSARLRLSEPSPPLVCPGAGAPSHRPSHPPPALVRRHDCLFEVRVRLCAFQHGCRIELTRSPGRPTARFPPQRLRHWDPAGGFPHAGVDEGEGAQLGPGRSPKRPTVRPKRLPERSTFQVLSARSTPHGSAGLLRCSMTKDGTAGLARDVPVQAIHVPLPGAFVG